MGNIQTIEEKKKIYDSLEKYYEELKVCNDNDMFKKMLNKYERLTSVSLKTLDLFDLDTTKTDGIIKTDTFTLIGWNEGNDDIDLEQLEKTLKENDNREDE